MDQWKIGHVTMQVELQKLNEAGEVAEKQIVPGQPNQPSMVLLGAQVPEELKKLIFNNLKFQENAKQ